LPAGQFGAKFGNIITKILEFAQFNGKFEENSFKEFLSSRNTSATEAAKIFKVMQNSLHSPFELSKKILFTGIADHVCQNHLFHYSQGFQVEIFFFFLQTHFFFFFSVCGFGSTSRSAQ
jgi:hypothetical protein